MQSTTVLLERNELLSPNQGAYHHGKSTEQLLLLASDTISQAMDSGKPSCIAFLDLHKAFDSLCHALLSQRLHNLGLWGTEMAWFLVTCLIITTCEIWWSLLRMEHNQWTNTMGKCLLFLICMNEMPLQVKNGKLLHMVMI